MNVPIGVSNKRIIIVTQVS